MDESRTQRFAPQISERPRRLPPWVAPHIEAAGARATTLNPSAAVIRDLCDQGRSIFQIVATLRERFVADDVQLYVDVIDAILELRRLGLAAWPGAGLSDRPPVKFVMGIEDKTYFHWQLPIFFESLIGQLPKGWEILVVVCNDHHPLSDTLVRIVERYGVTYVTGANHPASQNMDFAGGGDHYVPLNRIEALRAVAPSLGDDDIVCLVDTDNFLYRQLDLDIFPTGNALCANEIIEHNPFFTHAHDGAGVDLQTLLGSVGCQTRLGRGGVAVFLTGSTVKNTKFVDDCFRFTQVVYLLAKIAGQSNRVAWISEMPCFALSLTANAIPYDVTDSRSFMVEKARSVPEGTFYHYYGDFKDTSIEGAFYDSDWHKQWYFHDDFLTTSLEERFLAAVTPHEQYFFELARRAHHRLTRVDERARAAAGECR
jgi:hypothetical protein